MKLCAQRWSVIVAAWPLRVEPGSDQAVLTAVSYIVSSVGYICGHRHGCPNCVCTVYTERGCHVVSGQTLEYFGWKEWANLKT
jgi:hypothetical protein